MNTFTLILSADTSVRCRLGRTKRGPTIQRAGDRVHLEEGSIQNLVRAFLLQVYKFENALLEVDRAVESEVVEPYLPALPEDVLD